MSGRNEVGFAEPELVEFRLRDVGKALGLVDEEHHGTARFAQVLRDARVVRRQTRTGVAHEENDVGLFDREFGLTGHRLDDAFALHGLETARVDDDVGTRTDAALTVLTVAGEARIIGDDGVAASRESVEERRLADIRTTNECNNRKHRFSKNQKAGAVVRSRTPRRSIRKRNGSTGSPDGYSPSGSSTMWATSPSIVWKIAPYPYCAAGDAIAPESDVRATASPVAGLRNVT